MIKFHNKDMAIDWIEEDLDILFFCPIIKYKCNPDCICFEHHIIHEFEEGVFVEKARCKNPLITGRMLICTGDNPMEIRIIDD